jgi:hypothetical protein
MRSSLLAVSALLFVACAGPKTDTKTNSGAAAATLTEPEREAAVKDLEATKSAFLTSIQGLSEAQFKWKASPERWSVAEAAEHIAVSEERLLGMITDKLLKEKTKPELLAQVQKDDDKLKQAVLDRTNKRQAPEMLKPTGRFPTVAAVTAAFTESRGKTVAFVQNTKEDLRGHASPHPILKALDGYQWVLLLSAHSARHTAQIEEVKADPNFPRQ